MPDKKVSIESQLMDLDNLQEKIEKGEYLIVAGDEALLKKLPSGNWIGGSIPYFMDNDGGLVSQDKLFVHTIRGCDHARISPYDVGSISRINEDAADNGFTIIILPAGSEVHAHYAQNSPAFPNMFFSPIIGWVAGVHLDDVDKQTPKIGFGPAGMLMENSAVAMHVPLPEHQFANIHTINLFEQGKGPAIKFPNTGFNVDTCTLGGKQQDFAQYLLVNKIDTRLPLVADYNGTNVNVSIQKIDTDGVKFYGSVFSNVSYQFASPISDYVTRFNQAISDIQSDQSAYSCNCILNFLYGELEGKKTGSFTGPMVFGEVAYQLLNQTLVFMTLENQ